MDGASDPLRDLGASWAEGPRPILLYNKSHSGSRLLARALEAQGIFMGAARNDSEDSLPVLELVELLVERWYPDYSSLWRPGPAAAEVATAAARTLDRHLAGFDPGAWRGWGIKLCEAMYALPILDAVLPGLQVVHLVRDGRDVAWSDHVAPERPFWRKVYFNTDRLERWEGRWLTHRAYARRPHVYNARHWVNSVEIGRAHGAMLRERYREVRYEDLCADFAPAMGRLLEGLGLPPDEGALARLAPEVRRDSVGKHRARPARAQAEVLAVVEPTLRSLGYEVPEGPRQAGLWGRVLARLSGA